MNREEIMQALDYDGSEADMKITSEIKKYINQLEADNKKHKDFYKYIMEQLENNEAVTDTIWVTDHPCATLYEVIENKLQPELNLRVD